MTENLLDNFTNLSGNVGFCWYDLLSGEHCEYNPALQVDSASVIKLFVMAAAFAAFADGELAREELFELRQDQLLPSCGALNLLTPGERYTALDLVRLMIALSDNTATNMLTRRLGLERVNAAAESFGCQARMRRLLFDSAASAAGLRNTVSAGDCQKFFLRLYRDEQRGDAAATEMLSILKMQKLNGKMPFFIHSYRPVPIAHKTGEDTGVSHDVGIVYAQRPFIACFCAEKTDVPVFERVIQDVSWQLLVDSEC